MGPRRGSKSWRLLSLHETPEWQHDNEYILSGYRPTSGSVWESITSLLYLNNQTINAYSHLIGAVAFATVPFYFYYSTFDSQPNAQLADFVVFAIYCLGVTVCFTFSFCFHIFCNHSYTHARLWNKLDYLGILILMWGAGVPTIYYGFACNYRLTVAYWIMTTSAAGCCTYVTLIPKFASPKFRHWRAGFYTGFGFTSIVFVVHGVYIYGWELQKSRMSLTSMGWMASSNLAGAVIYAARVPERWIPLLFDTFGASHQIFHVAVLLAAWIHLIGLLEAFHGLRTEPNICDLY